MRRAKAFIICCCFLLQACGEKFYEQRPFDVSQADQVFVTDFVVKEEYDYRFGLQFNWIDSDSRESMDEQEKVTGGGNSIGIPIPMIMKIFRNGELFLDVAIQSDSAGYLGGFCYNTQKRVNEPRPSLWEGIFLSSRECNDSTRKYIYGPSRTLQIRTLPPGKYHIEIKTLISIAEFSDMETFIEISPYSPKT